MLSLQEKIEAGRRALEEADADPSLQDQRDTQTNVILGLRDDITRLRNKGMSWSAISERLHKSGSLHQKKDPSEPCSPEYIRLVWAGQKKHASKKTKQPTASKKVSQERSTDQTTEPPEKVAPPVDVPRTPRPARLASPVAESAIPAKPFGANQA
jgi:hypothetical protein